MARPGSPGIIKTDEAGQKRLFFFAENSDGGRGGQRGLKEPADEFCLALGSGFGQYMVRVAARRCLGDFEFCRSGEKAAAADDSLAQQKITARSSLPKPREYRAA